MGGAGASAAGAAGEAGGSTAGGGTDGGDGGTGNGGEAAAAGEGGAQSDGEAGAGGTEEGGSGGSTAGAGDGGAAAVGNTAGTAGGGAGGTAAGGLGNGGGGAGGTAAGGVAGTGGTGPGTGSCLTHAFQWIDMPSGTLLVSAHVYLSSNGCVVTGYLRDSTNAPKGVFRWTEAGGVELLVNSETLVPWGISQDGSTIIAGPNSSGPGSTWTRAQGWVADASGRRAYVISGDGTARAGSCATPTDTCYWKNSDVQVIAAPPPAPDGTPGSHVGVNPSQISADGSTVAGEAILWDSTHAGTVTNYIWTKSAGTQPVALLAEDHLSIDINSNGTVLEAQRHAYTLNGSTVVQTRTFLPPPTAFQNPIVWLDAMSDDATTFVGRFEPASGGAQEAYIARIGAAWSPASMADRLIAHAVQLNGDRLHRAIDASANGKVVVGFSTDEKRIWLATSDVFD
jgi:hypothetical protein